MKYFSLGLILLISIASLSSCKKCYACFKILQSGTCECTNESKDYRGLSDSEYNSIKATCESNSDCDFVFLHSENDFQIEEACVRISNREITNLEDDGFLCKEIVK